MSKYFAAIYGRGPDWIPGKSITQQPLGDHVKYLKKLHAQNVVKMGGPFEDGEAGLVILEASNLASTLISNESHSSTIQSMCLKNSEIFSSVTPSLYTLTVK